MRFLELLREWSSWIWPLVADHLWQSTVFAALALLLALLMRRGPARARYAVWLVATAKIAVPSFALFLMLDRVDVAHFGIARTVGLVPEGLRGFSQTIDRVAAPLLAGRRESVRASVPKAQAVDLGDLYSVLTLVWAAGFATTTLVWARRRSRHVAAVWASGCVVTSGRELEALERACFRVGVPRSAKRMRRMRLIASPEAATPGVYGVVRSMIVLPEGMGDRLTDAELEALFLHELVHVRRRDNLTSHLSMILCCLFWFFPVVWLVDRRLLAERERVCDDEVLRLGRAPGIYASSLVKACRYGLGQRVAGVSAASSAGLRARVERILARGTHLKLTPLHCTLVAGACAAFVLFLVAGCLGAGAATASDDTRGARPVTIAIEGDHGGPVLVLSATVRSVRKKDGGHSRAGGEELFITPTLTLQNDAAKSVVYVRVRLESDAGWTDESGFLVNIEPKRSYVLEPDPRMWSNSVPVYRGDRLTIKVVGARFDDGTKWGSTGDELLIGATPAPAPRARPRSAISREEGDTEQPTVAPTSSPSPEAFLKAGFDNPPGAPLVILDAHTRAAPLAAHGTTGGTESTDGLTNLPALVLENTTSRRITSLKLRFKAEPGSHGVTAFKTDIPPMERSIFRSETLIQGDPARMRVQVIGVGFEDGSIWGEFDNEIDARDDTIAVPQYIRRPASGRAADE